MRKLYRSRYDKRAAGICGGMGNYLRVDPAFIRLTFVFFCVLTGFIPLTLIYFISALIIPLEPRHSPAFEYKRLYRSSSDRVLSGLCGGLARHFKMDPTVFRLIMIVVTLISGFFPMLVTYLVAWSTVPEK